MSYDPDWMRHDSWLGNVPMMKPEILEDKVHRLALELLGIDPVEHRKRVDELVEAELKRNEQQD